MSLSCTIFEILTLFAKELIRHMTLTTPTWRTVGHAKVSSSLVGYARCDSMSNIDADVDVEDLRVQAFAFMPASYTVNNMFATTNTNN